MVVVDEVGVVVVVVEVSSVVVVEVVVEGAVVVVVVIGPASQETNPSGASAWIGTRPDVLFVVSYAGVAPPWPS